MTDGTMRELEVKGQEQDRARRLSLPLLSIVKDGGVFLLVLHLPDRVFAASTSYTDTELGYVPQMCSLVVVTSTLCAWPFSDKAVLLLFLLFCFPNCII